MISRRLLQFFVGLNALVAVYNGGAFLLFGIEGVPIVARVELSIPIDAIDEPARGVLDTWYRALGWVWLSVGLMLAWILPSVERSTAWFRFIHIAFLCVGIGRLASVLEYGVTRHNPLWAIAIEIVVPLAFIAWQSRVASSAPEPAR
jgi:hypothetical protein